jgi:hypothetical protein
VSFFAIDKDVRDITQEMTGEAGLLRVMPASYYAQVHPAERALACLRNGWYGLPTIELCDWLNDFIAGRSAIEIGAGNGALARYLGIRATDNYMQEWPHVKAMYESAKQPPARYGADVEEIDALHAVKKYRPQVVIGSWITHRWNPAEPWRGGNMYGPDIPEILKLCEHYVHIGNEGPHAKDPMWEHPHKIEFPSWLYSRTGSPERRDFIATWASVEVAKHSTTKE